MEKGPANAEAEQQNRSLMERRDLLRLAAVSAVPGMAAKSRNVQSHGNDGSAKPNIIIVMADQVHAGLTKRSGFPLDVMPTLDSIADQGVSFDRAYACAPLCVPSRVSLLTGRWPHAHRVRQNSAASHAVFERDLFGVVKDLGYKTGLAGKNHSYLKPADLDFWREYGHSSGWKGKNASAEVVEFDRWLTNFNHGIGLEPTAFPVEVQNPYRIVSDAIEFIGSADQSPFALWVSFPEPHNPYQVPKPYFDMFPPDQVPEREVGPEALDKKGFKWHWLEALEKDTYPDYDQHRQRVRSNYLGMLRLIDDQLKRLVGFLDTKGLRQNTILVYLTDHGDYFTDYGLIRKGVGMPEDLIHIPMVWAGPGVKARKNKEDFVSTADIMPTLCEALGVALPHGSQGRSLWPMLRGAEYPAEEFQSIYSEVGFGGMYYESSDRVPYSVGKVAPPGAKVTFDELNPVTQSGNLKMLRKGDWKLLYDMMGNGELYDLSKDPYELTNLFEQPESAAQASAMLKELLAWTIRTEDDLPIARYQTKWPEHNWYAPHRHGLPPA